MHAENLRMLTLVKNDTSILISHNHVSASPSLPKSVQTQITFITHHKPGRAPHGWVSPSCFSSSFHLATSWTRLQTHRNMLHAMCMQPLKHEGSTGQSVGQPLPHACRAAQCFPLLQCMCSTPWAQPHVRVPGLQNTGHWPTPTAERLWCLTAR